MVSVDQFVWMALEKAWDPRGSMFGWRSLYCFKNFFWMSSALGFPVSSRRVFRSAKYSCWRAALVALLCLCLVVVSSFLVLG